MAREAARRFGFLATLVAAVLTTQIATDRAADACGSFGRLGSAPPSVAVERVLLVHDEAKGVEHFVREIAFASVKETFGFVVPTPSRATVAKVDDVDWSALDRAHPFAEERSLGIGSLGFGGGDGRLGGAGVKVLEHKRVGSFASYVLEAGSGEAMKKWLGDNRFETTPASAAWLEHYVRLGFSFVALRFEPQLAKETRRSRGDFDFEHSGAETVRISFETPVPYYPYREPDLERGGADRILALWLLSPSPKVPVALRGEGDAAAYVRPWREGLRSTLGPGDDPLAGAKTWKAIQPSGPMILQTFEDQKTTRRGFGDVVLVPEQPTARSPEHLGKQKRLLGLLDPRADAK